MMVMTDLLSDPDLPKERRKEFTNNILIQLERLNWLVSALLKFSKLDAGTAKFKRDRIMVKELIQHILKGFQIPMEIKRITVKTEGEDGLFFKGDFHWTVEALTNIIKNCIEHTPNGGTLFIKYTENPLYTEIKISD